MEATQGGAVWHLLGFSRLGKSELKAGDRDELNGGAASLVAEGDGVRLDPSG